MLSSRGNVLLFLTFLVNNSFAQNCKTCKVHPFTETQVCRIEHEVPAEECLCPSKEYCNVSEKKCKPCDHCHDAWNDRIRSQGDDVQTIFEALVQRYGPDSELEKLLKILVEKVRKQENDLEAINDVANKVSRYDIAAQNSLNNVTQAMRKIEKDLNSLVRPVSQQDLIKVLQNVRNELRTLVKQLQNLNLDVGGNFSQINDDVETVKKNITWMNEHFPRFYQDSLGLALSLEGEIDELRSIIRHYDDGRRTYENFPKIKNTRWIEQDITAVFEILNNYLNASIDGEQLLKNATSTRQTAEEIQSKLNSLLEREENLENLRRQLKYLIERLERVEQGRRKLEKLLKAWKNKKQIAKNLKQLDIEIKRFDERTRINILYEKRMDKLLREAAKLLSYNITLQPLADVDQKIKTMIKNVQEIQNDIESLCKNFNKSATTTNAPV